MPTQQPFTVLCHLAATPRLHARADLHLHTTHSDGSYSPAELVDLARRAGLAAIAVTDHDTLSAVAPARAAARGVLEVVAGVEITSEFQGRELHLLGYFVDPDDTALNAALRRLREQRVERFREMRDRLKSLGILVEEEPRPPESVGRRHLAELMVRQGKVASVREAFLRYLSDGGRADVSKRRLPVAEAIALVRAAGGVSSWAHPSDRCSRDALAELRDLGLGGVEVEYPSCKTGLSRRLRAWAAELGLAVSGGSDCHGPGATRRTVGACTITSEELEQLRGRSVRSG